MRSGREGAVIAPDDDRPRGVRSMSAEDRDRDLVAHFGHRAGRGARHGDLKGLREYFGKPEARAGSYVPRRFAYRIEHGAQDVPYTDVLRRGACFFIQPGVRPERNVKHFVQREARVLQRASARDIGAESVKPRKYPVS